MRDVLRTTVLVGVFLMPFIPLLVTNSLFFPFITGKNFMFRIIVEIIFAAWILLALYDSNYRPKFSWLLIAFTIFIAIIGLADAFGVSPFKSFWSNFERMEGFVTLVHLFLYFIVTSHVLNSKKLWDRFFNTTLFAASLITIFAFAQLSGSITINQGGLRVDATLGNAAYFAIYMLFHTFIAFFMFARAAGSKYLQYVYGALMLIFAYFVIQTATRGTILGLTGGVFITSLYIVIFGKQYPKVRKIGAVFFAIIVLIVTGFFAAKDTDFIKSNKILNRVASISLSEAGTRFTIWGMALEGVKERPILGWGQGNFNYVFNKEYEPSLWAQEAWFDRVHNIFFDWLIAGGILGLLGYLSIMATALYYAVLRPLIKRDEEQFSVIEQATILGLFGAYFAHNLVVFDNIISYFFYGSILAMIHSRVGIPIPKFDRFSFSEKAITQIVVPIVGIALVATIYFVNVPGLLASSDIIKGFRAQNIESRMDAFNKALSRDSFGNQEIREQLMRVNQSILQDTQVPEEIRTALRVRIEDELNILISERPNDARARVFISSFYRSIGDPVNALVHLEAARALSPRKQQILFELGLAHMQMNNIEAATEVFKEAYELAPEYERARTFYAAMAIYNRDGALFTELITHEYENGYIGSDFILGAAYNTRQFNYVIEILSKRLENSPENLQLSVSLAVSYHESGDTDTAINVLQEAVDTFPEFKVQGEQYIADLKAGRSPGQAQ